MVKDILGQEIKLGDYVVYSKSGYVKLYHGIVTKMGNVGNVKVNDRDWPSGNVCMVVNNQLQELDDKAKAEVLETKEKHSGAITKKKPSTGGVKHSAVVCQKTDKLYVISFTNKDEQSDIIDKIAKQSGIHAGQLEVIIRSTNWRSGVIFYLHPRYLGFSKSCLSGKAIKDLELEYALDKPNGVEYSSTILGMSPRGTYTFKEMD